jgi:MtaA/CmuA family methyltransferase
LAAAMMGIDQLMLKLVDDPPFVRALMERCAEYGLAYGRALSDAGADMLSGGDSPAGLIGPRAYREFALPFEQRLIASLKSATRKPVSLHICGNALPILRDMATSGADVLEIDHRVDISAALDAVPPGIALWGNLDPVQILSQGTAMEVRQAAKQVLEKVRAAKRQDFVLSSGCTLAVETPAENLVAMLNSVL